MSSHVPPRVAVVDDDHAVLDLYAAWLEDEGYEVLTASDGPTALERIDDTVDVVLLDRRMPGMKGDEVLHHLRSRGTGAMVAMATAVEPKGDIVDLPFDDYLVKPIEADELVPMVESLLYRAEYNEASQRCFRLASKIAVLEDTFSESDLESNEAYHRLKADLAEARRTAEDSIEAMMGSEAMSRVFADI